MWALRGHGPRDCQRVSEALGSAGLTRVGRGRWKLWGPTMLHVFLFLGGIVIFSFICYLRKNVFFSYSMFELYTSQAILGVSFAYPYKTCVKIAGRPKPILSRPECLTCPETLSG